MTDEERKAIEWFRNDLAKEKEVCGKYNDYKKQIVKRNERILWIIQKQQKEIEEFKKYDIRNIKINEEDKIKSPSIPKEKLDLINMGIALYKSFDKIFKEED